jgi:ferritin-like metal-binding protein YciE
MTTKNKNFSAGKKKNQSENESSTKEKNLETLLESELKDIYSAEKQLVDALPEMAQAVDNEDLEEALNHHLEQTRKHVSRLEKIFERHGISKSSEKKCEAMEGLIKESNQIIKEFERGPVRDAALIISAQKIEHYEIASYGSLCELADVLGEDRLCDLLGKTLDEEEQADNTLTEIAKEVNDEAVESSLSEAY